MEGVYDLIIANGDFVMKDNTMHHQRNLILNDKGSYKENPTICVGAFGYLDDEGFSGLARATSIEFTRDGMRVNSVQLNTNGQLETDAYYP